MYHLDYLILGKIEKQNNTKNIIYVESEADTVVSAVYKFVIRDIAFAKENTGVPVCILGGVDKHGIFGDHEIILGYYATKDEAKKELQEILNAIDCGKNIYKLKYNSELKGTKLKVIK